MTIIVSATYDHIVAIVIVGMIFIGTVVVLPAVSFSNIDTIDQQQLRNTAYNVFDAMLLDVGSSSNWGSTFPFDQSEVQKFGLAYADPFSKFVLDPDKVQRLDPENPGVLEYERVRDLLKLEDYGFQFSLYRPFRVNWTLDIASNEVLFSTTVTRTEDGTPIPNAEVRVTFMVTASKLPKQSDGDFITEKYDPVVYYTNVTGSCTGSLTTNLGEYNLDYAVAIMKITVSGLSTTVLAQNDNPLTKLIKINTFGDTITLSFPDALNDTSSERRIVEIDAYDFKNLVRLFKAGDVNPPEVKITQGSGYEYWSITFPGIKTVNPSVLLFAVQVTLKGIGRTLVLIAGPFSFGDSEKIFDFGPNPYGVSPITLMRRLVVVSDMTYVAELAFWRE